GETAMELMPYAGLVTEERMTEATRECAPPWCSMTICPIRVSRAVAGRGDARAGGHHARA
ncbi:hypothetical protein, partial [Streptomyces sp. Agncl-13]|uniref:hypothetical protein n=1 Tax=Streptomyces sp. Agncl-13 TaxID=3400628 RepID=UPI003A85011E